MAQRRAVMPSLTLRALRTAAAAVMGAVTKTGRKADGNGKVIFFSGVMIFNMVHVCEGLGGFYPSHLLLYKDGLLRVKSLKSAVTIGVPELFQVLFYCCVHQKGEGICK